MSSTNGQRAICFLTRQPNLDLIKFAKTIHQNISSLHGNVFIIIDDDNFDDTKILSDDIHLIHIDRNECIQHGFQNSNLVYTNEFVVPNDQQQLTTLVIAWDKALYYFCRLNTQFEFVWLVEDDVFIPSIDSLRHLTDECSLHYDLVTPSNRVNLSGRNDDHGDEWYWYECQKLGVPMPWYRSMVCAMGLSRRLLIEVDQFTRNYGRLGFIEYMFNTLAMHAQLKVYQPLGWSKTIVWQHDWTLNEIKQQLSAWYHPMKNFRQHSQWRKELE